MMKTELKFKTTFDELDEIFFLQDFILSQRFVNTRLSRAIGRRISDTFMNWNNYLHSLILPNPGNLLNVTESKMFTDNEKEDIIAVINQTMALASKHSLNGLRHDREGEAKFIDDSATFWKKTFLPKVLEVMEKVNSSWVERANTQRVEEPPSQTDFH